MTGAWFDVDYRFLERVLEEYSEHAAYTPRDTADLMTLGLPLTVQFMLQSLETPMEEGT